MRTQRDRRYRTPSAHRSRTQGDADTGTHPRLAGRPSYRCDLSSAPEPQPGPRQFRETRPVCRLRRRMPGGRAPRHRRAGWCLRSPPAGTPRNLSVRLGVLEARRPSPSVRKHGGAKPRDDRRPGGRNRRIYFEPLKTTLQTSTPCHCSKIRGSDIDSHANSDAAATEASRISPIDAAPTTSGHVPPRSAAFETGPQHSIGPCWKSSLPPRASTPESYAARSSQRRSSLRASNTSTAGWAFSPKTSNSECQRSQRTPRRRMSINQASARTKRLRSTL